jgi:hypothetical protein
MPIFTGIGVAVATGVGLAAGTAAFTFVAGATAFGLQVAAGIGVNLLAKSIAGKQSTPQGQQTGPGFSVQGKLQSGADTPRSFPLGWRVTAGSLVWANTWGKFGETPNAYLTQVIALSDLPLRAGADGLVGLWANDTFCTIDWDDSSNVRGHPVEEYKGVTGKPYMWIRFHDGTQTEADELCVNHAASAVRPYESTRVGTGVAYAVVTSLVQDRLFSGFPQFKFELGGIKLYDPSKDSTVGGSGSQRWNSRATWGGDGDHLPAVQIYNVLRGISYGGDWLYGLQNMAGSRLPAAHWIEQIEKCRFAVDKPGGGTEPRYRSSLEVAVNNNVAETVEALLTACQGRLAEPGGFYKLHCGAPDARTNLLLHSQSFNENSVWGRVGFKAFGSGSVVNAATAPDDSITADFLCEDTSTGGHYLYQLGTKPAQALAYTLTCYAKNGGRSLRLYVGDGVSASAQCTFNLSTGTAGTPASAGFTSPDASIEALPGGWYRCRLTFITNTNTGVHCYLTTPDGTGDGTSGVFLWGAQLERDSVAGSYIPTTSAPAHRARAALVFTDDDILSTEEQTFTPFYGLSDTVNGITAKYPEPDEGWNYKPAPPIYRSDLEVLAGNRHLLADVALDAVPYARQVQQLMLESLQEAQRARRHTLVLGPSAWVLEPGDIVEWSSDRNGYINKTFRLDGVLDKANLDVVIDITEIDESDYDFDVDTDYEAPVISEAESEPPPAQDIVGFTATANTVTGASGAGTRPGILLEWDVVSVDLDDVAGLAFEIRRTSDEQVIAQLRSDDPFSGEFQVEGNGLLPLTQYDARARYIPNSDRDTNWSDWETVTTGEISIPQITGNQLLPESLLFEIRQNSRMLAGMLMAEAERSGGSVRDGNLFRDGFNNATYIDTANSSNYSRIQQDSDSDGKNDWVVQPTTTGSVTKIPHNTGTVISGPGTSVTNPGNAFDNTTAKTGSTAGLLVGTAVGARFIGKSYAGDARSIRKAMIYPPTAGFQSVGANTDYILFTVRASQTPPNNPNDGTIIANPLQIPKSHARNKQVITLDVLEKFYFTQWQYVWLVVSGTAIELTSSRTISIVEVEFYENVGANNMTLVSRWSGSQPYIQVPAEIVTARMWVETQVQDDTVIPGRDFKVEFSANNAANWTSFDSEDIIDVVVSKSHANFTSVAASAADEKYTFGSGDPIAEGFAAGMLIQFGDLTGANNGVIHQITGFGGTSNRDMYVDPAPSNMSADTSFSIVSVNHGITDLTQAGPIRIYRTRFTEPDVAGSQLKYRIRTTTNKMIRIRRVLFEWLYQTVNYG